MNGYVSKEIAVIDGSVAAPNETSVDVAGTPKVLTWTIGVDEEILADTFVKFKILNVTIPAAGTHTDAILELLDATKKCSIF